MESRSRHSDLNREVEPYSMREYGSFSLFDVFRTAKGDILGDRQAAALIPIVPVTC